MNHETLENWIRQRAQLADQLTDVPIDVSDRVLSTLARFQTADVAVDKTPLILGAGLLALATSIVVAFAPSLTTVTQPWIGFWLF